MTEDIEAAAGDEREDTLPPFGEGKATFTASVDPRSKAEPHRPIRLTLDPVNFHFFDPTSGEAVGNRRPAHATASRP